MGYIKSTNKINALRNVSSIQIFCADLVLLLFFSMLANGQRKESEPRFEEEEEEEKGNADKNKEENEEDQNEHETRTEDTAAPITTVATTYPSTLMTSGC